MNKEFLYLNLLPLFGDCSKKRLESASLLWDVKQLMSGETLWWQGEPATEFGFVVSGRFQVHIVQKVIGEVRSGEMIGESGAFCDDQRTASVSAMENAEIIVISKSNLGLLRNTHPEIYDAILDYCLDSSAKRVHEMGMKIAKMAKGDQNAPRRVEDSALSKWIKRLTGAGNQQPASPLPALRKLPKLKKASEETLEAITKAMTPHYAARGKPVFLQGDPGDSVFLLAEGCVDVIRNVKGDRGERLASLYPGALFGTGSLLLKKRRNAACVASEGADCWIYEMDRKSHDSLKDEPGRIWKESLLNALSSQLRNADDRLVQLMLGGSRPKQSDYDSIRAGLEGYQGK